MERKPANPRSSRSHRYLKPADPRLWIHREDAPLGYALNLGSFSGALIKYGLKVGIPLLTIALSISFA